MGHLMGKAVRDEFWTKGFVVVRQALSARRWNAIRDQGGEYLTAAAASVTGVARQTVTRAGTSTVTACSPGSTRSRRRCGTGRWCLASSGRLAATSR